MEKNLKKNRFVYIGTTESLCCTAESSTTFLQYKNVILYITTIFQSINQSIKKKRHLSQPVVHSPSEPM